MNTENFKENITTIAMFIAAILSPYLAIYGVDEGLTQSTIIAIACLLIAVINAYYPNKLKIFGNKPEEKGWILWLHIKIRIIVTMKSV